MTGWLPHSLGKEYVTPTTGQHAGIPMRPESALALYLGYSAAGVLPKGQLLLFRGTASEWIGR